ncbi:MAG: hypothetical protein I8H81_00825 [Pseudomonadales bacterium]|nr:hypothetical protein [Pseudomonadales bacterium]MBH2077307.1 hypothetical protein [Pseudomonadales bacterium]
MNELLIEKILGKPAVIFPPFIQKILEDAYDTPYMFMDIDAFNQLNDATKAKQTYWLEMLYRAHWAATSNLVRHTKWLDGCIASATFSPNFISFCSNLRGLLESATDAYSALGDVAETLANATHFIDDALALNPNGMLATSDELEKQLIHFNFARKLEKNETAPFEHRAKSVNDYILELDGPELPLRKLYSELCQVVHPAFQATSWLIEGKNDSYWITKPDDISPIQNICDRYANCIEFIQLASANTSFLIYKAINNFNCKELHNTAAEKINMSNNLIFQRMQLTTKLQRESKKPHADTIFERAQ